MKTVHLITDGDAFKAQYWDRERAAMRPHLVFVDRDGSVVFESNEAGLKGDPIDGNRKLSVIWGDSVVFSSGRGWPCLLDRLAPGYQFLNGGLEGDLYTNILRRAGEFNRRYPVALNLLMLGWHPFVPPRVVVPRRRGGLGRYRGSGAPVAHPHSGNENIRRDLTSFLEQVPNTIILTMPTALNEHIIDRDLSDLLIDGDDETGFRFLGDIPYQIEGQRWAFEHVLERNAIAQEVCTRLNIPLFDLFAALDTKHEPDFRTHFMDILHLRPRSYPLVVQLVYDGIRDLLV